MRKRLVIAVIATAVLLIVLSGVAGAWFTDSATATVSGRTGLVSIRTWNVTLTDRFQPGDTQYTWLKVHNNGNCPIILTSVTIHGLPGCLSARFDRKPLNQVFKPCQSLYFKLYVYMPTSVTGPQNVPFSFKIRFQSRNVPTAWPAVGHKP